jgi:hypothetical protein
MIEEYLGYFASIIIDLLRLGLRSDTYYYPILVYFKIDPETANELFAFYSRNYRFIWMCLLQNGNLKINRQYSAFFHNNHSRGQKIAPHFLYRFVPSF